MIDEDGYRPNVGIVLCNREDRVFWAQRSGQGGWQFPQGGIQNRESPQEAMYRELYEEVGLAREHVVVVGRTRRWLHYDLPPRYRRTSSTDNHFKGQKQLWYLLRLLGCDDNVCLDHSDSPEFEAWRWIDYWEPVNQVIEFKREVYRRALAELEPLLLA